MILDLFFKAAVPFLLVCMVVAKIAFAVQRRRGIYASPEGALRRDEINRKYRTNRGAVVITVVFALLWVLMLLALIEEWGAVFFTFVVSALMLIPFMAVCAGAIMIYMFAIHAKANARAR